MFPTGMNWRRPRTFVALGILVVAGLSAAVFWTGDSKSSSISLTFLHSTNHPTIGTVGVFELVNSLQEPISIRIGFYKQSARLGVGLSEGEFAARPLTEQPVASLAAQSTNRFEMWVPTKGGPYRAVLHCVPASKTTPAFYRSRVVRFAGGFWRWAKAWGSPRMWGEDIVYGTLLAESQPFEIKP